MPYTADQVYQEDNFIFATKEDGRLPTLYFRTNHGSGRLRQEHKHGPKIQDITKHISHAFFKTKKQQVDFYHQINDQTTRDDFRKLRRTYQGTNIPKEGYYHVEAAFDTHEGTGKALTRHKSGGVAVGEKTYLKLKENVDTIYQDIRRKLGL